MSERVPEVAVGLLSVTFCGDVEIEDDVLIGGHAVGGPWEGVVAIGIAMFIMDMIYPLLDPRIVYRRA